MGLFNILIRFKGDTSGIKSSFKEIDAEAARTSEHLGHVFTHAGLGLLGIHSLSRTITHMTGEIISWSKDVKKTREEFEKLGITIEEGTLANLAEAGVRIDQLRHSAGADGGGALGWLASVFQHAMFSLKSSVGSTAAYFGGLAGGGSGTREQNEAFDRLKSELIRQEQAVINARMGNTPEEIEKWEREQLQRKERLAHLETQLGKTRHEEMLRGIDEYKRYNELIREYEFLLNESKKNPTLEGRMKAEIAAGDIQQQMRHTAREIYQDKADLGPVQLLPGLGHATGDSLSNIGGFGMYSGANDIRKTILDEVRKISGNTEGLKVNV